MSAALRAARSHAQDDFPDRVAKRIRALRGSRKLTLEEAAKEAKLGPGALSEIENGKRWRDKFERLELLSKALGVKPADLLNV